MKGRTLGWRVVRRTKRRRWYISSKNGELWTEDPNDALLYKNRDDAENVAWVQRTLGIRTITERVSEGPAAPAIDPSPPTLRHYPPAEKAP